MFRPKIILVLGLVICDSKPAIADETQFGLAVNKLEHLFDFDVSVFEVEATYGGDTSFAGLKIESEYLSGTYKASESQLYYSRSLGSRVSGIVGARYVDWEEGGDSSGMFGVSADLGFGIEVLALGFLDGEYSEGRVELERPTALSERTELQPKVELRAYSNDVDLFSVETRLAYATTERLKTYLGFSWLRVIGTTNDQDELTALAGLSYEW